MDVKSFKDHVELLRKPTCKNNILTHKIETSNFQDTTNTIRSLLEDLEIDVKIIEETKETKRWELTAHKNTWSNQRQKRRLIVKDSSDKHQPEVNQELHVAIEIESKNEEAHVRMFFISGNMSKDSVNQILQYLKNKTCRKLVMNKNQWAEFLTLNTNLKLHLTKPVPFTNEILIFFDLLNLL